MQVSSLRLKKSRCPIPPPFPLPRGCLRSMRDFRDSGAVGKASDIFSPGSLNAGFGTLR